MVVQMRVKNAPPQLVMSMAWREVLAGIDEAFERGSAESMGAMSVKLIELCRGYVERGIFKQWW